MNSKGNTIKNLAEENLMFNTPTNLFEKSSVLTIVEITNSEFLKKEISNISKSNNNEEKLLEVPIFSFNRETTEPNLYNSASPHIHIQMGKLRWLICIFDCLLNICKCYCMDTPQPLQTYFSKGKLNLSCFEYNNFYAIFAYFFILTFFSGYFSEKISVRVTLIFFCLQCFVGHFLFTIGGTNENYIVMLIGRCFFGIGSFCLGAAQDVIISGWFFDHELAFALGLKIASCRLGSALTLFISPKIMIDSGYFQVLSIGLWLILAGILLSIAIAFIDWRFEQSKGDVEEAESFVRDFSFIQNGLTIDKLKGMGIGFWFLVGNVGLVYTCHFAFANNSIDILCSLYDLTPLQAGKYATMLYFSACLSPFVSYIIDKTERRINIMIILLFFMMIPYFCFFLSPVDVSFDLLWFNLIFIGFFTSSYISAVLAMIPLLIEGKKQCVGFAILSSITNISLIIASFSVSFSINENKDLKNKNFAFKYQTPFEFMICCLLVSFFSLVFSKISGNHVIQALNSVTTNQDTRNFINNDPNLGEELLEIIKRESEKVGNQNNQSSP